MTGLSVTGTATSSIDLRWNDLSPDAQITLQSYQLVLMREGRQGVELERSIPFFSRTFAVSNLLPGVTYEVILRGVFVDDVMGVDATITVTTQELGKLPSRDNHMTWSDVKRFLS